MIETNIQSAPDRARERLLRLLALATFIIFFQAYMVAPIIPALSERFHALVATVGLIVPAYLITASRRSPMACLPTGSASTG